MPDEQERNLDRGRAYEAPAVTDLGTIDRFTQGDQDSVIDEPTP
jgi:hypothetical protein